MQKRRFSVDLKTKIPGGHPGLYGVPIQLDSRTMQIQDRDELARRFNGMPILLDRPAFAVAMYLDAHARMDEHSADKPILFLVTRGNGWVRIGGANGETTVVTAGDALLWPAGQDHTVWTEDDTIDAILIHGPVERDDT